MKDNIKLLTKFQKDLLESLSIYNSIIISGNIEDSQVYKEKNKEQENLVITSRFHSFLTSIFDETKDYLIINYDPLSIEGKRFSFLSFVENDKRIQRIKSILQMNDEEDDAEQNEEIEQSEDNQEKDEYAPLTSEEAENALELAHSNSGLSVDLSRIHFVLTDSVINKNNLTPIMFIISNASKFALRPGDVNNEDEQLIYTAIYRISQDLELRKKLKNKMLYLTNKDNDMPPWLLGEEYNTNVKLLKITKPEADIRKEIVQNLIQKSKSKIFDEYKNNTDDDKDINNIVTLLEGYSIHKIQKLFDYIELSKDKEEIKDLSIKDFKKILHAFSYGTQVYNPWENEDTFTKITEFAKEAKEKLSGQDSAIDQIAEILASAVTGMNRVANPKAPRVVLFLSGPTGTGKTEMSKIIAEKIFGDAEKMIRFDMSEFSQEHADQRLFGAPPGYVGYDAGGELTNAIMQNPFSLVLFDEIEKANGKIMDKFLQILSDGRLTDGQGRTISFENSIIVMTSNAGLSAITKVDFQGNPTDIINPQLSEAYQNNNVVPEYAKLAGLRNIEYAIDNNQELIKPLMKDESDTDKKSIAKCLHSSESQLKEAYLMNLQRFVKCNLSYHFESVLHRKEIYGRLYDSVVVYNYISYEAMKIIALHHIKQYVNAAKTHGLIVNIESEEYKKVEEFVIESCNQTAIRELGGRGISKEVQRLFANSISNAMVKNKKQVYNNAQLILKLSCTSEDNNKSIEAEIILDEME